jgi:hypothetical protein
MPSGFYWAGIATAKTSRDKENAVFLCVLKDASFVSWHNTRCTLSANDKQVVVWPVAPWVVGILSPKWQSTCLHGEF